MAKRDYYEVLGVPRDAGDEDVKNAFRKQAMKHHPDRNPGDKVAEAAFKDCNEAYDVLKDGEKRAAYDRYGHAAFEGGGGGGGGAGFGGGGGGFEDIFEQMFGANFARGGRPGGGAAAGRGADLRTGVEIGLDEAYAGVKKTIRVPSSVSCEACSGTGAEGKAQAETCGTCKGAGKVRAQNGFFLVERTCPTCGGQGRTIRNPCKVCQGAGRVQRDRSLSVAIPAGVEDGTRIRLSGEGEAGLRSAPAGDLYVDIGVRAHPLFQRDGQNIFVRVPLRMAQAALGGSIEVPSIDGGRARVTIPQGTQTGDQFRLRGKGFSVLRSAAKGDMYVQVSVETPQGLTGRQRELLEEFEAEAEGRGSPESEGFLAKVKEFWEGLGR